VGVYVCVCCSTYVYTYISTGAFCRRRDFFEGSCLCLFFFRNRYTSVYIYVYICIYIREFFEGSCFYPALSQKVNVFMSVYA